MNFILYRAQRFFAIQRRGSKTSFIREEREGRRRVFVSVVSKIPLVRIVRLQRACDASTRDDCPPLSFSLDSSL